MSEDDNVISIVGKKKQQKKIEPDKFYKISGDLVLPLDDAIKSIKKDLKEYSDSPGLGNYIEDRKKELAACMKAKKEGIPA